VELLFVAAWGTNIFSSCVLCYSRLYAHARTSSLPIFHHHPTSLKCFCIGG
jgi:hypothetical protein